MVSVPLRGPPVDGRTVTPMVQVEPGANEFWQSLVCEKSPFAVIAATERAPLPLLVSETLLASEVWPTSWFPKSSPVGLTTAVGAVATPVPARGTVRGLPRALSVIASVPLRAPLASGLKVTAMEQLPPGATAATQPLLARKSLLAFTALIWTGVVPTLRTVTSFGFEICPDGQASEVERRRVELHARSGRPAEHGLAASEQHEKDDQQPPSRFHTHDSHPALLTLSRRC